MFGRRKSAAGTLQPSHGHPPRQQQLLSSRQRGHQTMHHGAPKHGTADDAITSLKESADAMMSEQEKTRVKEKRWHDDLQFAQAEIARLEAQISAAQQEAAEMRSALTEDEKSFDYVRQRMDMQSCESDYLRGILNDLTADVKTGESMGGEVKQTLAEHSVQLQDLAASAALAQERSLLCKQTELADLRGQMDVAAQRHLDEKSALEEQQKETSASWKETQLELRECCKLRDDLAAELRCGLEKSEADGKRLAWLEGANDKLADKADKLEVEAQAADTRAGTLEEGLKLAAEQYQLQQKQLEESDTAKAVALNEVARVQQELTGKAADLDTCNEALAAALASKQELEANLERLQADSVQTGQDLTASMQDVTAALQAERDSSAALQKELQAAAVSNAEAVDTTAARVRKEMQDLQLVQLRSVESETSKLMEAEHAKVAGVAAELKAKCEALGAAQAEHEKLQASVAEEVVKAAALSTDLEAATVKMAVLSTDVTKAQDAQAVMQRHLDETKEDARSTRKKLKDKLQTALDQVKAHAQEVATVREECEIKTAELLAAQAEIQKKDVILRGISARIECKSPAPSPVPRSTRAPQAASQEAPASNKKRRRAERVKHRQEDDADTDDQDDHVRPMSAVKPSNSMRPPSRRLPRTSRMSAMSVSVASEGLSDGHETEFSSGTAGARQRRGGGGRKASQTQSRPAVKQSKDIFAASGGQSPSQDPYRYASAYGFDDE